MDARVSIMSATDFAMRLVDVEVKSSGGQRSDEPEAREHDLRCAV
jgi:hypothetical protein